MNKENKLDKRKWEKPEIRILAVNKTNSGTNTALCEGASYDPCTPNGEGS